MRAVLSTAAVLLLAFAWELSAQRPPLADDAINRDRELRAAAIKAGRWTPQPYKPGFFGTIFQLLKEQVNDTKSAYSQISTLLGDAFTDEEPPKPVNGTTEAPAKISRAEFLRILDRNLKGLRRLRDLEWREAKKDSWANIQAYKEEARTGKKPSTG